MLNVLTWLSPARFVFPVSVALALVACGGGGGGTDSEPPPVQNPPVTGRLIYDIGSGHNSIWSSFSVAPSFAGVSSGARTCTVSGRLPNGITLDPSTCELTGAFARVGSFSATVWLTVEGYSGNLGAPVELNVNPPDFDYRGQPITEGIAWKTFSRSTPRWDGYQPAAGEVANCRAIEGLPPLGLTVEPNSGAIEGTWIGLGGARFRVACDVTHDGTTVEARTVFEVENAVGGSPQVIYPSDGPAGRVGQPYTSVAPVFDNGDPITGIYVGEFTLNMQPNWACSPADALPPGLTLDPTTGVVSGTPAAAFSGCISVRYLVTVNGNGGVSGMLQVPVVIQP